MTNAQGRGLQYVKTMYSTVQAWNADESRLLLLRQGYTHELYDGRTYTFIRSVDDINPADGEQVYWDTSDPQILYYADPTARTFVRYNVETKVKQVLRDFKQVPTSCTSDLSGGADPQYTSWGSPPTIGLKCGNKHFAYDAGSNRVGTVQALSVGSTAAQASPDGTRFFLSANDSQAQVRDFDLNLVGTLAARPAEHGTITTTSQGAAFVAVQFDNREGIWSFPFSGATPKLVYGPANGWPYPPSDTHVSGIAYRKPGWIVVTHVGPLPLGRTTLQNEIVLANVDTGAVCRVAHHRSAADNGPLGYFAEPHPVLSPSGMRIAFTSDWGGQGNAETYVVELPGYSP